MEEKIPGIQIRKGGKLIETYWHYNKKKKAGLYKERNLTKKSVAYLFEPCTLEDGLLLKDIFLLLNTNLDIFKVIIGNWCSEFVQEGLKPLKGKEAEREIEFLELYSSLEKTMDQKTKFQTVDGGVFPELHGTGFVQKKDKYMSPENGGYLECKAGKRISYSVSFMSASELARLPIKLSDEIKIYDMDNQYCIHEILKGVSYSLGQILYGIIWELSFYGPPVDRNQKEKELKEAVKSIEKKIDEEKIN